jgi:hypothetical protein
MKLGTKRNHNMQWCILQRKYCFQIFKGIITQGKKEYVGEHVPFGGVLFLSFSSFCNSVIQSSTKNFNLGYNFWMVSNIDFDILHECSLWQDLSVDIKRFYIVTLTLVFDLLIENFNLGSIFWMVDTGTLKF